VLAHLRRRWSLSGREGFGFLSPSRRACEAGFDAFWRSETPIFYCAESQKRNGGERRSLWWPDAAPDAVTAWPARPVSSIRSARLGLMTGRWSGLTSVSGQFTGAQKQSARPARPVPHGTSASGQASRGAESSEVMIGHEARPVMYDQTCTVIEGAYWTQTGRWHCRVRSFARARPVVASRARGAERSARPVSW
jgi:hypothetical protein